MTVSHTLRRQDGSVAWLTFNRPDARNAMTWDMYEALVAWCHDIEADPSVRVGVLAGAGDKAFVAGTDISQFTAFETREDGLAYERRIDEVIDTLASVSKPTIAAIDGVATGGGAVLAVACDLRICSSRSRLGVPIARTLGNCLSAANHMRLIDLIGPARLKQLLFTGDLVDAPEALRMGLVTHVVEPDAFPAAVEELAERVAANAPLTVRATKEMVRRIDEARRQPPVDGRDLIETCYTSADFKEGVRAFLEKRRPVWSGS